MVVGAAAYVASVRGGGKESYASLKRRVMASGVMMS